VQRAVNLKNGDALTLSTVKRMHAFFSRHQKNYRPDNKEPDGGPTAGTIAWLLWGGNAGKAWANGIVNSIDKSNAGYVPQKGYDDKANGKPEFMEYAKDGEGGGGAPAAGPAGGPDAGDVHVPSTEWGNKKPKKRKAKEAA
jgi:hypothetical protein